MSADGRADELRKASMKEPEILGQHNKEGSAIISCETEQPLQAFLWRKNVYAYYLNYSSKIEKKGAVTVAGLSSGACPGAVRGELKRGRKAGAQRAPAFWIAPHHRGLQRLFLILKTGQNPLSLPLLAQGRTPFQAPEPSLPPCPRAGCR